MRSKISVVVLLVTLFLAANSALAQAQLPPETRNAALRYWLAFAELQDTPADAATQELLEKTAAGEAAWDEAKLGPILDKNLPAIRRMQRATELPECDWGLEYRWNASIAYAPRARVLARLNALYGMRLAAQGNRSGAVDAWLNGVRFSQHVAQGGTLIFALIAQSALLPNLSALTEAAESSGLSNADRGRIEAAVRALPESAFDWSGAMRMEEAVLDGVVEQLTQAANPAEFYASATGQPAPRNFSVPSAADWAYYHNLMSRVEEALRLPPAEAQGRLVGLSGELGGSQTHEFFRRTTPSFLRVNESRATIAATRERLLQALAANRRP
jgi:hypothetical protein